MLSEVAAHLDVGIELLAIRSAFGRDMTVSAFAMMKTSVPVRSDSRARRTACAPSRASM